MIKFNLNSWKRKDQYDFFIKYDDPFFNMTSHVDVTNLYRFCKDNNYSFFLSCLHNAIEAANEILEFRLRIIDHKVYEFESIDIGSTVINEDNSFSFCFFERRNSIKEFNEKGKTALEIHKKSLIFDSNNNNHDLIHCSFIPWISFTSFKHARSAELDNIGIPKFVFGKYLEENNFKKMPISIEVHHALMDGFHVAKFLEIFQSKINGLK